MITKTKNKNKGSVSDLNEVMVEALWGKLFHINLELGKKDDWKALVRACNMSRGNNHIVHLGINMNSSTHNCRCVVDGGNTMAAIWVLLLLLLACCLSQMHLSLTISARLVAGMCKQTTKQLLLTGSAQYFPERGQYVIVEEVAVPSKNDLELFFT